MPSAPVDSAPTELAPIEKSPTAIPGPASNGGAQGAKSPTGRASYEAVLPNNRVSFSDGERVSRAMAITSVPTTRSARGSPVVTSTPESTDSFLDNLPPVEVPRDWARNDLPPAAELTATPTTSIASPKTESSALAEPSAEASRAPSDEVSVAPGIQRFVALEPKLSGGSLPSNTGLDWLVEKGYKTILDLRETRDVQPTFIEEVAKRGMRYIVLPVSVTQLDSDHISRFNYELTQAEARPLYFCDADGTRAGVLWYIRRMTVDKVDAQAAGREADELGLKDGEFRKAASAYLESLKPAVAPAPAPVPAAAPTAAPGPAEGAKTDTKPVASLPIRDIEHGTENSTDDVAAQGTTAWKPYAALMFTGLGIPLAYWSRSALPTLRMLARASLPGPARRPRSLPAASGE